MKIKKVRLWSLMIFICGTNSAFASYLPTYGYKNSLEKLSEDTFYYSALETTTNSLKFNETTGILKTNLLNMNQKQLSYSLSSIENMQQNAGSGIYFKKTSQKINALDTNALDTESYQNIFSSKFALNAEDSIMATINEGQNSLEQITLFNGLVGEAETKSLGLSLAFNKKLNNNNLFAFIGKNWTENNFETLGKVDGEQFHFGFGANYKTSWDNVSLTPQFNLQKMKSVLRNNLSENNISGDADQTTAVIGIKTNYQVNNQLKVIASVNYEKDLKNKSNLMENNTVPNSKIDNPDERYGVAVSFVYNPVDKMDLVMDFKHKTNSQGNDKIFNVGLRYHF